jgi:hypothetical protein
LGHSVFCGGRRYCGILIFRRGNHHFLLFLVSSANGDSVVHNPATPKVAPVIKDDFEDDELVAFAANLENIPPEKLAKQEKKKDRPNNPLFKYRRGVLSVSDLSAQIWCEQQLIYKFLYPFVLNDDGEIKRVDDKPHMLRGTSLHLERELEIQTKITIECKTREDSYGVRLLNMIQGINGLLTWNKPNERYITREMPVKDLNIDLSTDERILFFLPDFWKYVWRQTLFSWNN